MNIEQTLEANIMQLSYQVESIDIKGQYVKLSAPIHLTGQLNISALLIDYPSHTAKEEVRALQIGVDEAGRGPLLGSVNVAAALLPSNWSGLIENRPLQGTPIFGLTDSKQLSEKKRDILYPLVQQYALGYIIAAVPAAVIDQVNILQATMLGMRLCTEALLIAINKHLTIYDEDLTSINSKTGTANNIQVQILYDGNRCPELDYGKLTKLGIKQAAIDCQAWVKGDARHTSIAAASILAKVSRDQAMYRLDAQYPEYGIGKHKGYPTRAHMQALETYGVLAEHRHSFAPVRRALEVNNLHGYVLHK